MDYILLKKLTNIDNDDLKNLYSISVRTHGVYLLLATIICIQTYSFIGSEIIIWIIGLYLSTAFRIVNIYNFNHNFHAHSIESWYLKFAFFAFSTAAFFSLLGFYFMSYLSNYYQLFIVLTLIGLSSSSILTLGRDRYIGMIYIFILLFPLGISLLSLDHIEMNSLILFILVLMYAIILFNIIIEKHKQNIKIKFLKSEAILLNTLFKNSSLGMMTYDKKLNILSANPKILKLFDKNMNDLLGKNLKNIEQKIPYTFFNEALENKYKEYKGSYILKTKDKLSIKAKAFSFNDYNNISKGLCILEDTTKENESLNRLEYLVKHDSLTGLLNRRGYIEYLDTFILHNKHENYYSVLIYIDLNKFKQINDTLGHQIGDEVLIYTAKSLRNTFKTAEISRLSGDEFLVLMPYLSTEENEVYYESKKSLETFKRSLQIFYTSTDIKVNIEASIGILVIVPNDTLKDEWIKNADASMYRAKKTKDYIAYYDVEIDTKQKESYFLQNDLLSVTDTEQLSIYLQPIVDLKSNNILSAESLLYWNHPEKGLLRPLDFIPLAAKANLLSSLTWWVIETTCENIQKWKKNNQWKLKYISVNIDPRFLLEKDFLPKLLDTFALYQVEKYEIILEITENSLIENFEETRKVISKLKEMGIHCAIDDFGIGYSSLSYLKELSVYIVKIDKSFVDNIQHNDKDIFLLEAILEIMQHLGYSIIVEGIETEAQRKILLKLNVNMNYQGYLFSKALPMDIFENNYLI